MKKQTWDELFQRQDIQKVIQAITSVQYGTVSVVIQDGKIIQIEKSEKERIR